MKKDVSDSDFVLSFSIATVMPNWRHARWKAYFLANHRVDSSIEHPIHKKNPPHSDSIPARSQPGGPTGLPFPAGHDIVPTQRLPVHFCQDVGAHEFGQGQGQFLLFQLDT